MNIIIAQLPRKTYAKRLLLKYSQYDLWPLIRHVAFSNGRRMFASRSVIIKWRKWENHYCF